MGIDGGPEDEQLLGETLGALQPEALLSVMAQAFTRFRNQLRLRGQGDGPVLRLAALMTRRSAAGIKAWDALSWRVAPEFVDVVQCEIEGTRRLPNVFPVDLMGWSVQQMEQQLAHYLGRSPPEVDRLFHDTGFIGPSEHVAELIHADAYTLQRLKIDRIALADRLQAVIALAHHRWGWNTLRQDNRPFDTLTETDRAQRDWHEQWVRGWQQKIEHGLGIHPTADGKFEDSTFDVKLTHTCGHQDDPFHPSFAWQTYSVADVGGSKDVRIYNRHLNMTLQVGDMLPYLIRTACFFEGQTAYRLDPEQACRVLGLS